MIRKSFIWLGFSGLAVLCWPALAAGACLQSPSGLIGWWRAEGDAGDSIGVNHGTLHGTITTTSGQVGQAWRFDSPDDFVEFPEGLGNFRTLDFSIECWFKTTSNSPGYLWSKRRICSYDNLLSASFEADGRIRFDMDGGNVENYASIQSATSYNDGTFHHAVFTRAGSFMRMFIDGTNVGNSTTPVLIDINNANPLRAGNSPCGGYYGSLDELSIYGRALSPAEVAALYNAGTFGKCTTALPCIPTGQNISAWWPFEELTGETAFDAVGSKHAPVLGTTVGAGRSGTARHFAPGDVLSVDGSGSLDITNQVTLEAWVRLAPNPDSSQRFTCNFGKTSFRDSGSGNFQSYAVFFESGSYIGLGANHWLFEYAVTSEGGARVHNQSTGVKIPADNQFHHIAMTYDGSFVSLYVDGTQRDQYGFSGNLKSVPEEPFKVYGGSDFSIDELAVYARALASSEIAGIYAAGAAGKCAHFPLQISPAISNILVNESITFTASGGTPPYTFSNVAIISGGGITANGLYAAGHIAGIDILRVIDTSGSSATGMVSVTGCEPIGAVSWWRANSNALDSIGTNHGTLIGGAPIPGVAGAALNFDGVDDCIVLAYAPELLPGTNSFTLEGWLRTTNSQAVFYNFYECAGSCDGPSSFTIEVDRTTGVLAAFLRDTDRGGPTEEFEGQYVTGKRVVTDGQWHHFASVRDMAGGRVLLYLDGVLESNAVLHAGASGNIHDDGGDHDVIVLSGYDTHEEGNPAGKRFFYPTSLDEMVVYQRALSAAEVQGRYNLGLAGVCGPPPPLVVSPAQTNVQTGTTASFTATGGTPPYLFTNLTITSGGGIAPNGVYTAGSTLGTDTIRVVDATGNSATGIVMVIGCAAIPSGLVGWWRAEDNANDTLSHIQGRLQGGTAFTSGKVGRAFVFDGIEDFVDFPTGAFSDLPTFGVWVKTAQADGVILDAGAGSQGYQTWRLSLDAQGRVLYQHARNGVNGYVSIVSQVTINDGAFHHVAATTDQVSKTLKLYVDGTEQNSYTESDPAFTSWAGSEVGAPRLGKGDANGLPPAPLFTGVLDEAEVYSRALSAVEVQQAYIAGGGGHCLSNLPPLIPLSLSPVITNLGNGASFSFSASGGVPPHEFSLFPNSSGGTLISNSYMAGLGCGLDLVTLRDQAGNKVVAAVTVRDTLPPMVLCPGNISADCTGSGGAIVSFGTAPVTDNCDAAPMVTFSSPSGSFFPLGVTTVTRSAVDAAGNSNFCFFTVTVRDTTPPSILCPGDMVLEATSASGAACTFSVTAVDACDPHPTVNCMPPSGTIFPIGNRTVTCSAVDAAGNPRAQCSFQVTVRDTTPPVITSCPTNRIVVVGPNCRAMVPDFTSELPATDAGGAVSVFQAPSPGTEIDAHGYSYAAQFPVLFLVIDQAGNRGSCTMLITFRDLTPPTINCPGTLVAEATSPSGAYLDYLSPLWMPAPPVDNCDPSPRVFFSRYPGGFPLGTTPVTCTATDASGNSNACTFNVVVRDTTPPRVHCENLSVTTSNPAGERVFYQFSTIDEVDPSVIVMCKPPQGSLFPPGTSNVLCSSLDHSGNSNGCSFTVTITVTQQTFLVRGRITQTGGAGLADVTLALSGGGVNASAATDASGNYAFNSVAAGIYTLRPTKADYTFSPPTGTFALTAADFVRNFSAQRSAINISGRVTNCVTGQGIAGVKVMANTASQAAFTDASGYYNLSSVPILKGVTVSAQFSTAKFSPGTTGLAYRTTDAELNFCARFNVIISGRVSDTNGLALAGTVLRLGGAVSNETVADARGKYVFRNLPGGNFVLTPTNGAYRFSPSNQAFTSLFSDATLNFIGVPPTLTNFEGRLALSAGRSGLPTSSIINADATGGLAELKPSALSGWGDQYHAWSPDGASIVFARSILHEGAFLHIVNADGTDLQRLVFTGTGNFQPAWSPDGGRIAYLGSGYPRIGSDLITISPSNTAPKTVVTNVQLGVAWAPDGSRLAFTRKDRDDPYSSHLYTIGTNGTGELEIPLPKPMLIQALAWLPTSHYMACQGTRYIGRTFSGGFLDLISTNGVLIRSISNSGWAVAWSPREDRLAYTRSLPTSELPGFFNATFTSLPDGSDERLVAKDYIVTSPYAWGRQYRVTSAAGTNVKVKYGQTSVTFGNVVTSGETLVNPISEKALEMPQGYFSLNGLGAYEVASSASFTGPITICFKAPATLARATFDKLRILHGENGSLIDRTILPPDSPAPDFANKTICARVISLSPFILAQQFDNALPKINGLVLDSDGSPLGGVRVALNWDLEAELTTDINGTFTFPNLQPNGKYTLSVTNDQYLFEPPTLEILQLGPGADVLFVGTNAPLPSVPALSIAVDPLNSNRPTLSWSGNPYDFVLEYIESIGSSNWLRAPGLILPSTNGVIMPLTPDDPERYFRLRRGP